MLIISVEKAEERKCHHTFIVTKPRRIFIFYFSFLSVQSSFCSSSVGFAKASADMQLLQRFDTSAALLKVRSDTILSSILAALKWLLDHHEALKFSTVSH